MSSSGAEISKQIKDNSQELQDYLKDLDRWESEIRKKDEDLLKNSKDEDVNNVKQLPPVRNSNPLDISRNSNGTSEKPGVKVDEGMESGNSESESSEGDNTEDEEYEVERKKQRAILEKDKGNELFKKGKYQEAICCYTRGIQDDPTNFILPANRAMALMKLEQHTAAEKDCTQSISLDHTFVKAFYRRGVCRLALKKYQLARQDFLKVIEMDPGNKQARVELDKINEVFKKREKSKEILLSETETETKGKTTILLPTLESKSSSEIDGIIYPIEKSLESRSKKPLRRLEIVDIPPLKEESVKAKSPPQPLQKDKPKTVIGDNEVIRKIKSTKANLENSPKTKEKLEEHDVGPSPDVPPIPINSFQFERDWRLLRHWPETQYKYLMNFPPENFSTTFKNSIETEIFTSILKILSQNYKGEVDIYIKYLTNLTKVGRFSTILMFLSTEEKKEISTLIQKVGETCTLQQMECLKQLYNI